eukprot:gene20766-32002_t
MMHRELLFAACCVALAAGRTIHVDQHEGDDGHPGDAARPLRTVAAAVAGLQDGDTVLLSGGVHRLREGVTISGKSGFTVQGDGTTVLSAGVEVPQALFSAVSGMPGVYRADLSTLDIELGEITGSSGLADCANDQKSELFYNDVRMVLARHPNVRADTPQPLWTWANLGKVVSDSMFTYAAADKAAIDLAAKAATEKNPLWVHGYWQFDWADNYCKVAAVFPGNSTIALSPETPTVYSILSGSRFMVLNSLSFVDQPGEYFVDYDAQALYVMPPAGTFNPGDTLIMSNASIGATIENSDHGNLLNASVMHAKNTNLVVKNSTQMVISGGRFSCSGTSGVNIEGTDIQLVDSVVGEVGCSAVSISGGDAATLTPSGNVMRGVSVERFGDWKRTYMPGLSGGGVGHVITENTFYNGPHSGILLHGNDVMYSRNNLSVLCYETLDSGAWYLGRSWTARNNTLLENHFSDIITLVPVVHGSNSTQAIYNDDQLSQTNMINNTFVNCDKGAFIGGGRHHTVSGNRFLNVTTPVHIDDRGLTWQPDYCTPPNGSFWQ